MKHQNGATASYWSLNQIEGMTVFGSCKDKSGTNKVHI